MPIHQTQASGGWHQRSLLDQLANVGSEVGRTLKWKGRRKELTRARTLLCDAMDGGREYGTTLEDLDRYFLAYAVAARAQSAVVRRGQDPGR